MVWASNEQWQYVCALYSSPALASNRDSHLVQLKGHAAESYCSKVILSSQQQPDMRILDVLVQYLDRVPCHGNDGACSTRLLDTTHVHDFKEHENVFWGYLPPPMARKHDQSS